MNASTSLAKAAWVALALVAQCFAAAAMAQRLEPLPQDPIGRFAPYAFTTADGAVLDVFIQRQPDARLPALLLIQGSGCSPLFEQDANGRLTQTSLLFYGVRYAQPVHLVAVEKRGVKSGRVIDKTCSRAFVEQESRQVRARDLAAVLAALAKESWVSDLLVLGHSEGADVAASVAALSGAAVRAVALVSGAKPAQLFDFMVQARRAGNHESAVQVLNDQLALVQGRMQGMYRGHAVQRWETFAIRASSVDELVSAARPTYIAHGTRDNSTTIESADYVAVELLRRSKGAIPLRYVTLVNADHPLQRDTTEDLVSVVANDFVQWALQATPATSFLLR